MTSSNVIASRIRELMKERHWTAYELAKQSGLSTSTLDNLLHERCKSCNFNTLINICRAFPIEVVEFIRDDRFLLINLSDDN